MGGRSFFIYNIFMDLNEAMRGTGAPAEIAEKIVMLDIPYLDFAGSEQIGQLLVHQELAGEVQEIFAEIMLAKFPIAKMVPIAIYNWDDHDSIRDNNSSAFNYRVIAGTDRLSNHATGRAIDINPIQNPYFDVHGVSQPPGYQYDPQAFGAITAEDAVVNSFKKRGWEWGGDWHDTKDYQHFQKPA